MVHRDQWFSVEEQQGIIVLKRSSVAYDTVGDLIQSTNAVLECVHSLPSAALLLDLRQVPGRNDPAFESTVGPFRIRLIAHFRRSAVLVESATGRLQLERQLRADKSDSIVFTSFEDAMAHLRSS